ncbi:MAG: hypothetical protein P8Y20_06655 [Gammaproteobacteria bacterium]|jgi:hypothetical protein
MNSSLQYLSEIVARANDLLYSKHADIETIMGIIDQSLRNQGIKADAVSIECISVDKKILILIHDDKPNTVDIILGNKAGDIHSTSEYAMSEMTEAFIIKIMEKNFIGYS